MHDDYDFLMIYPPFFFFFFFLIYKFNLTKETDLVKEFFRYGGELLHNHIKCPKVEVH